MLDPQLLLDDETSFVSKGGEKKTKTTRAATAAFSPVRVGAGLLPEVAWGKLKTYSVSLNVWVIS